MKIFKNTIIILVLSLLVSFVNCKNDQSGIKKTGNAPSEAFVAGSEFPYYGTEDPWNRRFFTEHIKDFYKRRGQRQMLDIVEGRPEEAAQYCRELLSADPNDLESLFNLVVALTQMNDLTGAMKTLKEAVKRGIPFGRFLAGPRDLLQPLTESDAFNEYASNFNLQLLHGPMLGCVTDHSAKFWVRTVEEVPVQIVLNASKRLTSAIRSEIRFTKADDDFTTILSIEGLQSDTDYYYDVLVNSKKTLAPNLPVFRTYPEPGQSHKFQIGFGGCAGYVPDNERMWDVISSRKLLAFLFMGDNVYINMPQHLNGVHYYTYYRRQSRSEYRKMIASRCIYAIWDDHDCATDDVWMGPFKDKPSWKMEQLELFEENWINPGYGDPEWPACWFKFSIADVDFFMLEGRFYRTNPYAPNPTMLGPVQKAWLKKSLRESSATFKVLASPVPWSFGSKPGAVDTWNGFPNERDELFDFLAENKIDGVFLLSADRHRCDIWKIERSNGYTLYEFENSRLTNQHVAPVMTEALFSYNEKPMFGLLTFDTTLPDPKFVYESFSIDDELIHTLTVKKSEISH